MRPTTEFLSSCGASLATFRLTTPLIANSGRRDPTISSKTPGFMTCVRGNPSTPPASTHSSNSSNDDFDAANDFVYHVCERSQTPLRKHGTRLIYKSSKKRKQKTHLEGECDSSLELSSTRVLQSQGKSPTTSAPSSVPLATPRIGKPLGTANGPVSYGSLPQRRRLASCLPRAP